jgi:hypothetical protein
MYKTHSVYDRNMQYTILVTSQYYSAVKTFTIISHYFVYNIQSNLKESKLREMTILL